LAPIPPPILVIVDIPGAAIELSAPLVVEAPVEPLPPAPTVIVYCVPLATCIADSEEPPPPEASLLKEAL